ncbi:hypothetical protein DH2020_039302 [Rehmannia glutinosa]|uniref:Uncharacterized protein n=1 Tax=Rehmannia glutinosa TaxID=99300 RepID=A0ABR0UWW9_REHGL
MSTSSSSSSEDGGGNDGGGGVGGGGDFEGPSSSRSRMRPSNGVWPEPFVETLAFQVAIDASRTIGRLAAAQALFNIFQVCSTWRAISNSDLLWQNLTRHIWNVRDLIHRNTWRDEYIYRHRTANNFRSRRYVYTTLHFVPTINNNNNNDGLSCRRLALSDHHLAAGFSDGAVHLFHLSTGVHLSTFYPQHRDRLGRFSSAVSGIILSDIRLVFATLDGDIHMAVVNGATPLRRAHLGDVVNDGALVDFSGCDRWWVGLYAGVPDHAFHIWNSETEELVFIGGTLTDPEAYWWKRNSEGESLSARSARSRQRIGTNSRRRARSASVRRVANLEEICRFTVRGAFQGELLGCVNGGYGLICVGGVIRVWEIEHGQFLYRFRERIGDCNALIADERYVAACSSDATIHLWDFGA